MNALRPILAAALTISALAFAAVPADASCVQESLADQAARADAVVHGRVTALEGPAPRVPSRFALVEVTRVLKGSAYQKIGVALGPGAEGGPGPGAPVATSVDYTVEIGSDHTFYLKQNAPGGYSTDACSGSHAGPPRPDEEAFFGTGRGPEPVPGGVGGASANDRLVAAAAMIAALAFGAAAIVYARRSARGATS